MRVALTFDTEFPGRPNRPGGEDRILETLADEGIRGTFFLQGRWVRANPELSRRIVAAGHLIGNHSNYHAPMDALSDEWLRRDIETAEATIIQMTGVDPKPWFRCPFGSGMDRHVGWDANPVDWVARTVDELVAGVGPGIVLLHAWPTVTADGLGLVITGLRERGAEFVGVDELV